MSASAAFALPSGVVQLIVRVHAESACGSATNSTDSPTSSCRHGAPRGLMSRLESFGRTTTSDTAVTPMFVS